MSHEHRPCPVCATPAPPVADPTYEPIDVRRGSAHHSVLATLGSLPTGTADDVAALLHASPNEVAARLLELRRAGEAEYVIDSRTGRLVTRTTRRGAEGRVQRLTRRGRATVRRLDRGWIGR